MDPQGTWRVPAKRVGDDAVLFETALRLGLRSAIIGAAQA
jgi:hypothetical protein